jgi:hypothetical protein
VSESTGWVVRFVFSYEGTNLAVVSQDRVEMLAPDSDTLDGQQDSPRSGFWLELHDEADRPLYTRVLESPLAQHVEVFSPDPALSAARYPVDSVSGTFFIVVPDLPDAHSLILYGSPLGTTPGHEEPAREIARFDLATPPAGG